MKKIRNIIAVCFAALLIFGTPMSVSAEEGRYDANYTLIGLGSYTDMGIYDPGTYIISASDLSDSANFIWNNLNFMCRIPIIGSKIPGCPYVKLGNLLLQIMPDTRFCVRLTDGETGEWVWEGELTSGQDELYLGDDHSCYRVEMKPAISAINCYVYLAKK